MGLPGDGRVVDLPAERLRLGPRSQVEVLKEALQILEDSRPESFTEVWRNPYNY